MQYTSHFCFLQNFIGGQYEITLKKWPSPNPEVARLATVTPGPKVRHFFFCKIRKVNFLQIRCFVLSSILRVLWFSSPSEYCMLIHGPHAVPDPGLKMDFNGVALVELFKIRVYQPAQIYSALHINPSQLVLGPWEWYIRRSWGYTDSFLFHGFLVLISFLENYP